MEMRAALSPTFMTSRNRPIFCELDDPGSGIRFPSSRHSSRIQRLLGRLKSCFVPPAHDCGRASELDTALSSSGGLRQPGHKHPSPPHADLLGLLEEPSEVIINIASPPPHAIQRQQPNGVYDRLGSGAGSVCATPSEQMIALGLLSSRCGTPEGVVEDPSPSQMPAKRCLMGLLKSGPQIFGTQQQQQAEGPQGELLGEPLGQPPEAQQTQQQQQSDQQTEPTLSCHAGGLQQLGQGQAQELQQAQLLQQQGHVLSQRRDASSAGTSGAACPERPSAAELREQEQHSSSLQAYEQQQAKQGTPALQIERGVSSAPAGAAEFSQQQQEQQRENSYEPLKPAATCHNRPSPHKQTGVAVRRTAVTLSQLLKAKAPTPPSSGKKRRRQPSPVPHEAAVRQSQNSKLLQAQRSLDAAKEAASRQQRLAAKPQPAAVRRPFQPVNQQGCRDLSKPSYRSKALHAILSPVKAHQPRQLARQASVTVSAGPGRVAGVVSAPTSPGLGAAGYAAAKRLTVSEPGSSVQAGHITSVPTSPAVPARKPPMRWNQTAAAQAAALRSKSQRQEGQPVAGRQVTLKSQALGRKDGPDDADQLAAVAAALHAEAHELASPEKTARPHYQQQRSSTPAEQQVSVFSGEAGVEPYSVQPRDRGKEQRRPASSSVPAAHLQALSVASEDDGSPVSMNKYQADRDQYLQVLQQLALGMDVSASTVLPHKLPTPPPLPAEVLGETALQPVQRPTQQQRALPGRQRPTDSVETVEAKAVEGRPSAVVPSLRRRAVAPQLAAARYMIQRNALVDEDVQSIDAVGTGVTQEAPAVTVQAHHSQQKLVSIHAAIHRALSSREGSTMKEGSKPEGSAGTDRAGYGAVARKAAGQQTQVAASQQVAGEAVVRSSQSVSDAFQRLFPGAPQRRPGSLLASISSTASESQGAYLPSKNKPVKPGGGQANGPVLTSSSGQEAAADGGDDDQPDQRILISEVDIVGVEGELKDLAKKTLTIKPNFAYTQAEVKEDADRIFNTGYFHFVDWKAEDTRDGIKLTLEVAANPTLRSFSAVGGNVLPQSVVQHAFAGMHGRPLNYNQLADAMKKLTQWYEDNGVLGSRVGDSHINSKTGRLAVHVHGGECTQVTDIYYTGGDSIEVRLAEAVVNRVALKYVDMKTGESREEGKTRPDTILRHLTTRPGQASACAGEQRGGRDRETAGKAVPQDVNGLGYLPAYPAAACLRAGRSVYNLHRAKKDVEAVYGLGIFEDVSIRPAPSPGSTVQDPHVDLEVEVKERKSRVLSMGGGMSQSGAVEGVLPGFVGRLVLADKNLFGLGQKLIAELDVNQAASGQGADLTVRVAHTDPWVRGDAYRTSRTISADYSKASTAVIHGRAPDDELAGAGGAGGGAGGGSGGGPAGRTPGPGPTGPADAVFVQRKVGKVEWGRPLGPGWHGNLGAMWQQARCVDDKGELLVTDHYGSQMAFNESGSDTLALGLLRVTYNSPSSDAHMMASMEQAVPIRQDYLNFNRLALRAEKGLPLGPASLWVCGKGGVILGDLPPYEAFPIGGTNSVRGYAEGAVGTGRKHATGTAELRVPLVKALAGTLFVDGGTDLDSGAAVPGDPAGRRQKPGHGYGYGCGVRIDTPLGPLRLEYGWNAARKGRFHLGIGNG
ncbi:hypothetical protein N2152v2_009533 [Parachlorella kessleri]